MLSPQSAVCGFLLLLLPRSACKQFKFPRHSSACRGGIEFAWFRGTPDTVALNKIGRNLISSRPSAHEDRCCPLGRELNSIRAAVLQAENIPRNWGENTEMSVKRKTLKKFDCAYLSYVFYSDGIVSDSDCLPRERLFSWECLFGENKGLFAQV